MVTAAIVICVSFLPWLSILFKQTEQAHAGYWIPKFEWWTIPKTWVDLLIHEDKPVEFRDSATTLTTSLVSLTVIFCFAWKVRTRGAVLLLAVIVSPIVCSAAISVIALPIITSKHYLTACGFFFCALAYVIRILLPRPVSNAAAGILIVNMLYVHLVTVLQHHTGCGLPSLRSRVQGRALFGFGFCGLASSFSTASFAAASFFALASRR